MEKPIHIKIVEEKALAVPRHEFIKFFKKNIGRVSRWLDEGLDPNLERRETLLGIAIACRNLPVIKKLFEKGALNVTRRCIFSRFGEGNRCIFHGIGKCAGISMTGLSRACCGDMRDKETIEFILSLGYTFEDDVSGISPGMHIIKSTMFARRLKRYTSRLELFKWLTGRYPCLITHQVIHEIMRGGLIDHFEFLLQSNLLEDVSLKEIHPFQSILKYRDEDRIPAKKKMFELFVAKFPHSGDRLDFAKTINRLITWSSTTYCQFRLVLDTLFKDGFDDKNSESFNRLVNRIANNKKKISTDQAAELIKSMHISFDPDIDGFRNKNLIKNPVIMQALVDKGFCPYQTAFRSKFTASFDQYLNYIDVLNLDLKYYFQTGNMNMNLLDMFFSRYSPRVDEDNSDPYMYKVRQCIIRTKHGTFPFLELSLNEMIKRDLYLSGVSFDEMFF